MDALKAYYTSDSEESLDDSETDNVKSVLQADTTCDKDLVDRQDGRNKINETVDYFGFSTEDTNKELSNDEKKTVSDEPTDKQETVYLHDTRVTAEVPCTSFWSDMDTSNLQSYQTSDFIDKVSDAQTSVKRKVKSSNYPDKRFVRDNKERIIKHSSGNVTGKLYSSDKNNVVLNDHDENTEKSRYNEKPSSSCDRPHVQDRKLYYIHSKIKPYLHNRNNKNTPPSRLEWTGSAHAGAINRIKWNISEYSHLFATCSMDATIKIWNIWSQLDPCLSVLRVHDKAVRDLDWNQNGKQLLSCSYDRTGKIIDIEKGVPVHTLSHESFVTCSKYHPGLPHVCITGEKDRIQIWDLRAAVSPCRKLAFKDPMGQIQDVVFTPDHNTVFSCSDLISRDSSDKNLVAWDFKTGAPLSNQIYQERYTLTRLKVHQGNRTLLAQSYGGYIAIFGLERPYKMYKNKRFEGHKLLGYSVGFDITADGSNVYSGSSNGTIHCYNYQTGKACGTIQTSSSAIMDVACHPVLSATTALCTWGGTVEIWK